MSDFRTEFKVGTYTYIWDGHLEELVNSHLGRDIEIVPDLECGNDSWHVFNDDPQTLLDDDKKYPGFHSETSKAIAELRLMGVLPDHPVLLWVMW